MWPSFTIRVLQDTDGWIVAAQFSSAIAISLAAWVAARYPKEKDRLFRKQSMRIHLASLKLFRSSVEGYFYIVFDGSDLPDYYDSTSIIRQAREEFTKFEIKKEEIASVLPSDAIEPFHNFLWFYKNVDQLSHEEDKDMYYAWQGTKKELDTVIEILEKEFKNTTPHFLRGTPKKHVNKK